MRGFLVTLLTGLAIAATGCSRAEAFETFTLDEHDRIIAENPGCHATCNAFGRKRTCTIKGMDCRAVCQQIPECSVDGQMVRVCALVRTKP